MKLLQRLMLVTVLFSFTVTGQSMYVSEASAGAADGQLSLRCPRPANWKLPNGHKKNVHNTYLDPSVHLSTLSIPPIVITCLME